jgi:hypothetical protein
MKYRKKPVEIEALQWTGENHREMYDFLTENLFDKECMKVSGENFYIDHSSKVKGGLIIKTLEGEHMATIGDYIIRGVKGEYYPCKEDIFNQTYEMVEDVSITIRDTYWPIDWWKQPYESDKVPYGSICACNPKNGGSGICGCTMGNQLVDNPKRFGEVRTTNFPF